MTVTLNLPSKSAVDHDEIKRRLQPDRLIEGFIRKPPTTDNQLWAYMWAFSGFRIPRVAFCPGHSAPFQAFADLYFERVGSAIILANRTGGKTLGVACLDVAEVSTKSGLQTIHFGGTQNQADKGYEYFQKFVTKCNSIYRRVKGDVLANRTTVTHDDGGESRIKVAPLTINQASSPHDQVLAIDEADKSKWSLIQQALSIPISFNGWSASTRIYSTRELPDGPMQRLLTEAKRKGMAVYEWCIWEILQKCGDTYSCATCPAWKHCAGVAKDLPGGHDGGWMQVKDWRRVCSELDSETIREQWFNELPQSELLIYGRPPFWSEAGDTANVVDDHEIPADATRYRAMDFGQKNPTWIIWVYVVGKCATVYDDYHVEHLASQFLAGRIQEIETSRPWHYTVNEKGSRIPHKIARSYADPAGADYRKNLRTSPVYKVPTVAAINARDQGMQSVRAMLEHGTLRFMRRAGDTIDTMKRYRYMETPEGKPDRENPLEVDDHGPDAVRYFVETWKRGVGRTTGKKVRL